jgi:hypothetical protein
MAASAASLVRATSAVSRLFPAAPTTPGAPPVPPGQPERTAPEQSGAPPQAPRKPETPPAAEKPPARTPGPETSAAPQPAAAPAKPAAAAPAEPSAPGAPATATAKPRAASVKPQAEPTPRAFPAAKSPTGAIPPPLAGQAYRASRRPARRWQLTGLVIAIVLLVGGLAGVALLRPKPAPGASQGGGNGLIANESAIRGQAVTWVTEQVDRSIAISCDAAMCGALAQHGFPASNLTVLSPTAPDPYGSQVLIASTDVRSQFASRLAFFAPTVIASFGAGTSRIDIRVIAANGAAYQKSLRQDLAKRRTSGGELAGNKRVTVTPAARAQLLSGEVDLRLVTALAFLASSEPVSIVSFGSFAPGAAADVPLRWAYLAESDPAVTTGGPAYVQSLISFARNLRPPYTPLSVSTVTLPGGRKALLIEFAAPSPLGLLPS